jgi:ribosome-binding factor A
LASKRINQISEVIRERLSLLFVQGEVSDPRLKDITIHTVKVSGDLSSAKVYYSSRFNLEPLPEKLEAKKWEEIAEAFKQASGYFRKQIASALDIRHAPELQFFKDDTIEETVRVGALINKLKEES